jgi:hypothetical protein
MTGRREHPIARVDVDSASTKGHGHIRARRLTSKTRAQEEVPGTRSAAKKNPKIVDEKTIVVRDA